MTTFALTLIFLIVSFIIYSFIVFYFLYKRSIDKAKLRNKFNLSFDTKICAFFHPSCNGGGGGERVLWEAIRTIQSKYSKIFCVVYCVNINSSDECILDNVNSLFGIRIKKPIYFVRLKYCGFLEPTKYKRFTMVGQSIGSIIVALEAINKYVPHVYVDTVGYAYTFLIFKLLGLCKTVAYVHYPTISSDMLQSVTNREMSINNTANIKNSQLLTSIKLIYYRIFAIFYGFVSKTIDLVMVNSSWTKGHIELIWGREVCVVYPPCDVNKIKLHFGSLISNLGKKKSWIISVGQFRPEKDHFLQLESFKIFIDKYKHNIHSSYEDVKLIIIGGCRSWEDKVRVKSLQNKCVELNIENYVQFKCNVDYKEMLSCFEEGLIGLHTMKNEHFGIAVVEYMSAGLIAIANNSGGPKLDIIDNGLNGFLANTSEDYATIFDNILSKPFDHWNDLRSKAKLKSNQFSSQKFTLSFNFYMKDVLN